MIRITEIKLSEIEPFWKEHIHYLVADGIITDPEDIEYFSGSEYRDVIRAHMCRETDTHHLIRFVEHEQTIGYASFCTYQSEDGKCFILDFWLLPPFRGNGKGHECFRTLEKYTRALGARSYELNSFKEDSVRFWKSLGFTENGLDEWGEKLFILR